MACGVPRIVAIAATAGIGEGVSVSAVRGGLRLFDVVARAGTGIDEAGGAETIEGGAVDRAAFALRVGCGRSADIGTFVPIETKPAQILEDAGACARLHLRVVEIFHSKNEPTAAGAHGEPCEQEGTGIAEVQGTGRAGGEAADDGACHDERFSVGAGFFCRGRFAA